jgi:hypothetical protein
VLAVSDERAATRSAGVPSKTMRAAPGCAPGVFALPTPKEDDGFRNGRIDPESFAVRRRYREHVSGP